MTGSAIRHAVLLASLSIPMSISSKNIQARTRFEEDPEGGYHNLLGDKITDPKHWEKLWKDTFYGYDFDNTMVRISLMNMVLHGIKAPQVALQDTLSKGFTENDRYTVVLANPPFKGSIDKSDINDALTLQTTKTEWSLSNA